MPHYNSVLYSCWPDICARNGLIFVDAHWPVASVIEHIGRARLVITEAMHGAIVADTLRIPWVPVSCSPAVLPFKWIDWTESLDLDYRPLTLPASSAWEALKHLKIRRIDGTKGIEGISDSDQDILNDFYARFGNLSGDDLVSKPLISDRQAGKLRKMTTIFDRIFSERAAQALVAASKSRSYLSKDKIFAERVGRLQDAVAKLQNALVGTRH
jgi:succinoglycan biosynthesis protein ExoV